MLNNKIHIFNDIYGPDKKVLELKLKDFEYINNKLYLKKNVFDEDKGFIIFYSPICKYSKNISNLIIELADYSINIFNFGAVNALNIIDGNDYVCNYENIKNYPTIKYLNKNRTLEDYKYEYTLDNLIYFINIS
jgi:hypothetical protein